VLAVKQHIEDENTVGVLDVHFDKAVKPSRLQAARLNRVEEAVGLHLHEGIERGVVERQLIKMLHIFIAGKIPMQ
jgi:hypothetical protein